MGMKYALAVVLALTWLLGTSAVAQPVALTRAHAHNDYEHDRPLLDALDHGFASVEADIYLIDGQLLVAHDREDVRADRTLEALYLDPLMQRFRSGGGRIYPDGTPVLLLIDFKSDAEPTYAALRDVLQHYADMLTSFEGEAVRQGAVTIVISGNRPREMMAAERTRLAAYDGRLEDLDATPPAPPSFIPLVSSNWNSISSWRGDGPLPDADRRRLRETVDRAHAQGRRIRFWATPDTPAAWKELYDAGVDLLNTDDLGGLRQFLISYHSH